LRVSRLTCVIQIEWIRQEQIPGNIALTVSLDYRIGEGGEKSKMVKGVTRDVEREDGKKRREMKLK